MFYIINILNNINNKNYTPMKFSLKIKQLSGLIEL